MEKANPSVKLTAKLAVTEASLRRWQSRLKRATNKVTELDKLRRRLQMQLLAVERPMITATIKALRKIKPNKVELIEAKADLVQAVDDQLDNASHGRPVEKIPAFLNRAADPLLAEKMTAARKRDEAAARSAMPLSGKAALAKIRSKK